MSDRVNKVLELQENGKDRLEIATIVGYGGSDKSKRDSLTRYMRKNSYAFIGDRFIYSDNEGTVVTKTTSDTSGTLSTTINQGVIKSVNEVCTTKEVRQSPIVITDEIKSNFIDFIKADSEIKELLEWYENNKNNGIRRTEVIDVIYEGIQIDIPSDEEMRTSIRVNKEIWTDFLEFCKKHKEFKQKDLVSMALKEFKEKYS